MQPGILAIDIGATGLKASVVSDDGEMLAERVRVATPVGQPPADYLAAIKEIAGQLPAFDRVSIGFPGAVRDGVVRTGPLLQHDDWPGFRLADAIQEALGAPCRLGNDADVQGFAVIKGTGLEMVVTLGTGFGSATYQDGRIALHLELAHHRFRKRQTYNEQLGDATRREIGNGKWERRVHKMIDNMRTLVLFDHLYIGGGNAKKLELPLPEDVSTVDNKAGITGGAWLWK